MEIQGTPEKVSIWETFEHVKKTMLGGADVVTK